jgi:hypothetical protein
MVMLEKPESVKMRDRKISKKAHALGEYNTFAWFYIGLYFVFISMLYHDFIKIFLSPCPVSISLFLVINDHISTPGGARLKGQNRNI